jgi:hypothetical protein
VSPCGKNDIESLAEIEADHNSGSAGIEVGFAGSLAKSIQFR